MQVPFFAGCSVIDRIGYHLQLQSRSTPTTNLNSFACFPSGNVLIFFFAFLDFFLRLSSQIREFEAPPNPRAKVRREVLSLESLISTNLAFRKMQQQVQLLKSD